MVQTYGNGNFQNYRHCFRDGNFGYTSQKYQARTFLCRHDYRRHHYFDVCGGHAPKYRQYPVDDCQAHGNRKRPY